MKTRVYASGRKTLLVLNDLIRINIDRITALEKAAHEERTPDYRLREAFYRMAIEGRSNVNDLHAKVIRMGGAPVTQATITGKIYLHWLETHGLSDESAGQIDSAASLSAWMAAGLATEEAYRHALDEHLSKELHELVENQLWAFERSRQRLTSLDLRTWPP